MWRVFKKKFQPNRSEGTKVTSVSKWALKIASADSADMDQTAAKTAWFWPSPSGELKKKSQLREYFPIHGAGRFRRRLAHTSRNKQETPVFLPLPMRADLRDFFMDLKSNMADFFAP